MRNPEQIYIPGTEPVRGPCDDALTAWQDSMEAAAEAAAEKKRKLEALLDRMVETSVGRVAYTDRRTKRKKWLVLEAVQKLRTVAAEQESEPGGDERPRGRRTARSTETADPFAATREALAADPAGLPENGSKSPQNNVHVHGRHDGAPPPEACAPGQNAASPGLDLLKPGQRRRARGVR